MHCRSKEQASNVNSKSEKVRSYFSFYKHSMTKPFPTSSRSKSGPPPCALWCKKALTISEEKELVLEDDDEHTCKEARGPEDRRKLSLGSTCSCRSDQDIYIVFSIRLTTIQATYPMNRSPPIRLLSFYSPYCQLLVLRTNFAFFSSS